jgi:hypothetical protein
MTSTCKHGRISVAYNFFETTYFNLLFCCYFLLSPTATSSSWEALAPPWAPAAWDPLVPGVDITLAPLFWKCSHWKTKCKYKDQPTDLQDQYQHTLYHLLKYKLQKEISIPSYLVHANKIKCSGYPAIYSPTQEIPKPKLSNWRLLFSQ